MGKASIGTVFTVYAPSPPQYTKTAARFLRRQEMIFQTRSRACLKNHFLPPEKSGGGFCILWWGWCIHCKNGADGGLTHERLYRGAGGGSWELYYINKSDGATDSEEIWNIEIYGT